MKRVVSFIVKVTVDSFDEPITRKEAEKEARYFIDNFLGTYRGYPIYERSWLHSSVGRSHTSAVKLQKGQINVD